MTSKANEALQVLKKWRVPGLREARVEAGTETREKRGMEKVRDRCWAFSRGRRAGE